MSRYRIFVTPRALREIKELPGHMRQRIRQAVRELAENPGPDGSRRLDIPDLAQEIRRLRIDRWRVLYAITEADNAIDVLAVRRRPPYDYGDLEVLLRELV